MRRSSIGRQGASLGNSCHIQCISPRSPPAGCQTHVERSAFAFSSPPLAATPRSHRISTQPRPPVSRRAGLIEPLNELTHLLSVIQMPSHQHHHADKNAAMAGCLWMFPEVAAHARKCLLNIPRLNVLQGPSFAPRKMICPRCHFHRHPPPTARALARATSSRSGFSSDVSLPRA